MHNYHSGRKAFPPGLANAAKFDSSGAITGDTAQCMAWSSFALPFLDDKTTWNAMKGYLEANGRTLYTANWLNIGSNFTDEMKALAKSPLPVFICPSDSGEKMEGGINNNALPNGAEWLWRTRIISGAGGTWGAYNFDAKYDSSNPNPDLLPSHRTTLCSAAVQRTSALPTACLVRSPSSLESPKPWPSKISPMDPARPSWSASATGLAPAAASPIGMAATSAACGSARQRQ